MDAVLNLKLVPEWRLRNTNIWKHKLSRRTGSAVDLREFTSIKKTDVLKFSETFLHVAAHWLILL